MVQSAFIKSEYPGIQDIFGHTLALAGDTLVVGAGGEDSASSGIDGVQADDSLSGSGAVFVFTRSDGIWRPSSYLKASEPEAEAHFGFALALSGDTLAVGADWEDAATDPTNPDDRDAGAVYVFERSSGSWRQQARLKPEAVQPLDHFGAAVALAGDTLVVAAPYAASTTPEGVITPEAGAVYVFSKRNGAWELQGQIAAANADAGDRFGVALALGANTLAVGADEEDAALTGRALDPFDNSAEQSGAVYLFERSGGGWVQTAYLKGSNTDTMDRFGTALALDGETLAVAADQEDSAATGIQGDEQDSSAMSSGAVYLFTRTSGEWQQSAYIKASNTNINDYFGKGLALSGATLAIGARGEASIAQGIDGDQNNNDIQHAGAAYLFTQSAGVWKQIAYLKLQYPSMGDQFGSALALSGSTLAVGAPYESSKSSGVNPPPEPWDDSVFFAGALQLYELQR